jgi:hypothetical protein
LQETARRKSCFDSPTLEPPFGEGDPEVNATMNVNNLFTDIYVLISVHSRLAVELLRLKKDSFLIRSHSYRNHDAE